MSVTPENEKHFVAMLAEIGRTHMPFGKFGPKEYPPRGVPLHDLPYEYLAWFQRKGFPTGRLGQLMEVVFLAKRDGADAIFDPLRTAVGGRMSLRRTSRRRWQFGDGGEGGSDA